MASTGFVVAGQGRNVARASHTDWANPGNIVSDNGTNATNALTSGESDWLVADTFDLSTIPDGVTITGIRVKIQALSNGVDVGIAGVNIGKDDSTLGTQKSPTALALTTSPTDYTFGGNGDLWGLSLSRSEVQATTFQVRVYVDQIKTSNASVDAIWVEVFYLSNTSTQKTVFLTQTGAGLTWTVPSDWNSTNNSIECIGGGGGGPTSGDDGSCGAGGGGYSKKTNVTLTVGAAIGYRVGSGGAGGSIGLGSAANGGDTWFNGAALASSTVGAEGGKGGSILNPGAGGAAANGVGDTKYSGGAGGQLNGANNNGGGGGGAAGPDGNGDAGEQTSDGGAGGDSNGGSNGTGGASGTAGTQAVVWMQTSNSALAGPGGGGGGDGAGGSYGGGGGGNGGGSVPGGAGAQGIIVITYVTNTPKVKSYIIG